MTKDIKNIFKNKYHFSIEDIFEVILPDRHEAEEFVNFWKILDDLNYKYDIKVALYLFYEASIDGKVINLGEVDKIERRDWVFYGPHAYNFETAPYNQTSVEFENSFRKLFKALNRLAPNRMAELVRLHYYSEMATSINFLKKNKVEGLFTTDKEVGSHSLGPLLSKQLLEEGLTTYNEMVYIRTQFRVENLANDNLTKTEVRSLIINLLEKYGFIILYVHSYELVRPEVVERLDWCFEILKSLGIKSLDQL